MATRKSPESSIDFYVEVLVRTLRDMAQICDLGPSFRRDEVTLRERANSEGLGFLTKTLPALGKTLDKCLASDLVPSTQADEWKRLGFQVSKRTGLPLFMGKFWELIFADSSSGVANPDGFENQIRQVNAVRAVRQICFCLYKLEVKYPKALEEEVLRNFVATDTALPEAEAMVHLSPRAAEALDNARLLVLWILKDFDPLEITPAHGPGAVASGERPWDKMSFKRFFVQLDEVYSYSDYFFFNYTHLSDELESLDLLTEEDVARAKIALVPKDSRGPRIISMEPLEIQWIQQGLGRALVKLLESPRSQTSGFVNFTDQLINRGLAQRSSCGDMQFDTLDMKDASDRVSLWLIRQMFPLHVLKCLEAARSQETVMPDGCCVKLRKFAPMGSALCFPVEALVFWALAVGSVQTFHRFRDIVSLPEVYVYGDDLILPHGMFEEIEPVFEELFLRFNKDKCCTGRFFRESCGVDAFKGEVVTPLRIKSLWGSKSPAAALSYVSYANGLRDRGCAGAADFLQQKCIEMFGPIPITRVRGKYQYAFLREDLGEAEVEETLRFTFPVRFNHRWQRAEVKVPLPTARTFVRGKPDWAEMLRRHSQWGSSDPFGFDNAPLGVCSHTVPHTVTMRGSWIDLYDLIS